MKPLEIPIRLCIPKLEINKQFFLSTLTYINGHIISNNELQDPFGRICGTLEILSNAWQNNTSQPKFFGDNKNRDTYT